MWVYDNDLKKREQELRKSGFDAYCLFSTSGGEVRLSNELNHLNRNCLAVPFLRMKRAGASKNSILVQEALFKGYVFIFVPKGFQLNRLQRGEMLFRALDRKENGGALVGDDRRYAEWILSLGGILAVSDAVQINDRVRIVSGPLLDLEGCITGFSRKNKNYRVEFEMMGHKVNTWLPFEFIEPTMDWREKQE